MQSRGRMTILLCQISDGPQCLLGTTGEQNIKSEMLDLKSSDVYNFENKYPCQLRLALAVWSPDAKITKS